jgi:mono/diheme cytochrome c family protein
VKLVQIIAPVALALVSGTQIQATPDGDGAGRATASQGAGASIGDAKAGRALFLRNCAHCHGADASGDEGPDLHKLDLTDEEIERRIQTGKKGQMTAFAGKLQQSEIDALVAYVRGLK